LNSSATTFSGRLRSSSLGTLPGLRYLVRTGRRLRKGAHLARVRRKIDSLKPGSTLRFEGYTVRFNDGPNLYILYKDIFVHRIYHFDAMRPDPLILDCGSNIGMSILYFKQRYPRARIVAFEPDPDIIPFLESNIAGNNLKDVRWLQTALSRDSEKKIFYSDGICGSGLSETLTRENSHAWKQYEVPCMRLRDYLTEPVDFLKMNIEGAEYEVLADSEDRLRQVREMIIEYHHLPGLPRSLHQILELLHRQGFEYLINDFDSETNGGVQPPFRLMPESRYFLLVYAKRTD
jgi:FkbM family methyltransferase